MLKIEKFTDVCMTGIPLVTQTSLHFQFSTHIISTDITPEMLKLCRVTKVKIFLLVLGYVYKFDLFEFSAAILEKGLLLQVKKNLVCVNRGRIIGHGVKQNLLLGRKCVNLCWFSL